LRMMGCTTKKIPQPFLGGDVIPQYMNVIFLYKNNDKFYFFIIIVRNKTP